MKELLVKAREEIIALRRRNEILSAKVEVMDLFACVLHTQAAHRNDGMTIDIAWELGKEIDKIDEEQRRNSAGGCC